MADNLAGKDLPRPISRVTLGASSLDRDKWELKTGELHPHDKVVGIGGKHGSKRFTTVSGSFPVVTDETMVAHAFKTAVREKYSEAFTGDTRSEILFRLKHINNICMRLAESGKKEEADETFKECAGLMLGRFTGEHDRDLIRERLEAYGELPSGAKAPDWAKVEPIYPKKEEKE